MPGFSFNSQSKLPSTSTTIFTVMSQLAGEYQAINLGQGFPGFDVDPRLLDLVYQAMKSGWNQYAPMPGIVALRELLSEKMALAYGHTYNPLDEITITAGGTQAIYTAISAFIKTGDEVILFAPAYDCYAPAVEINGGKVIWMETSYPDYAVNWENVRNAITPRTRMIVVNTPQNPSSAVWSKEDMNTLISLLKGTDIIVLSDEVYEHIVFDGEKHESCAAYPELAERSLIVYSFGKTLHVTGWKMGYITGPKELMSEFRKVHQYNVFSCNTPLQYAISEYMKDASVYLELSSFYQRKRDRFLGALKNQNFNITPAKGSYFQLMQYKDMKGRSDVELAKEWTIKGGITSIPLSVFYPDHKNEGVFRFCFAKSDELLDRAAEKINLL